MGPFLTPYLEPLLKLLLHPALAGDAAAGSLRDTLTRTVPARLLLEPVRGSWPGAAAAGERTLLELNVTYWTFPVLTETPMFMSRQARVPPRRCWSCCAAP
jgi:hypothetical protein